MKVIVTQNQRPSGLRVGHRQQARFFTGVKAVALIVPRFSVSQGVEGEHYVFKAMDGKLVRQVVKLVLCNDLDFEALEGLSPEDRILAAPEKEMQEGDSVGSIRLIFEANPTSALCAFYCYHLNINHARALYPANR